jgi:hypothetical protein
MPTQAHYIVVNWRINLSEPGVKDPLARFFAAVRPPAAGRVFFVDALCVGRESKD